MADEGIHEIQLGGKQLVFLFMAATVVAVVIFLCGVMVGRGVPARAGSTLDAAEEARAVLDDPAAASGGGPAPVTRDQSFSYDDILDPPTPPAETLTRGAGTPEPSDASPAAPPVPAKPAAAPAVRSTAAAGPPDAPVSPRSEAPAAQPARPTAPNPGVAADSLAEPRGSGFVVQVAAVRQRSEANSIARRLSGRGYPAFVTTSGPNFRVRVGKYNSRREAEAVASRLEREERFDPWITR